MKKVIVIFCATLFYVSAFSQIGGGAKIGYDIFGGGTGIKTLSLGGFGTYEMDNEILLRVGLQFGLPYTESSTYTASAFSSAVNPSTIQVNGEYKVGTSHIYADGIKFLKGGDADDGGLYAAGGLGITLASAQTTYDDYDRTVYSVTGFRIWYWT